MSAFHLPDETRLSQVHLRTTDLERAIDFYQGVLGFGVTRTAGPKAAFSAPRQTQALIVFTEDRNAPARPERATGLYHFAIRYPARRDLANALEQLVRNAYPIQGAAHHVVSEALYLADPDRNGVELYADLPRSQWVWQEGQIVMSTDPLDLDSLLATAEDSSKPVAPPPGTDIGHVHLHVADLKTAERFYQDFLGLTVTQRSYPGALFLAAGSYHHHIAVNTWAGRAVPPPDSVGLVSYRLEVPATESLESLQLRAPSLGYETRTETDPDLLRVRDPNGNWLELHCSAAGAST
jgi:catechol 2,3-dioxygenase